MLTVGGTYVDDLPPEHAAWLTYVRSTDGARTDRRDRRRRRQGGCLACSPCSPAPTSPSSGSHRTSIPTFSEAMRRPFVADGTVRYVGEPVVAVVAEDRDQGADAAELVVVDYDPLPVGDRPGGEPPSTRCCCSPTPARTSCMRLPRRPAADFAGCEVVVEPSGSSTSAWRRRRSRPAPAPRTGPTTAASSTTRRARAPTRPGTCSPASTASTPERVRVVVPDVGGGFGAKSRTYPEELVLGFWPARVGRPGAVDRDPLREHGGHAPRPRPGAARQASAAPATAASPPTSSTSCRTPGPTR